MKVIIAVADNFGLINAIILMLHAWIQPHVGMNSNIIMFMWFIHSIALMRSV